MIEYNDLLKKQSGFWDYNDLGTQSSPIAIPGTSAWTLLTNDEGGPNTNKANKPTDIADIWNPSTNKFDFSELAIGDIVEIRFDALLTTTSVNTEIGVRLDVAQGSASNFQLPFIAPSNFKSTVADLPLNRYNLLYIGSQDIIDNPSAFEMNSDTACTIKVNGWVCNYRTRSVL
jgi:hypothetical protein